MHFRFVFKMLLKMRQMMSAQNLVVLTAHSRIHYEYAEQNVGNAY